VITGLLANAEYQDKKDSCSPHCSDEDLERGKRLALVSTISTGVALLGAGVGMTLLLTGSGSSSAAGSPTLRVSLGPAGPSALASMGF
jgi:hypothetical protein